MSMMDPKPEVAPTVTYAGIWDGRLGAWTVTRHYGATVVNEAEVDLAGTGLT